MTLSLHYSKPQIRKSRSFSAKWKVGNCEGKERGKNKNYEEEGNTYKKRDSFIRFKVSSLFLPFIKEIVSDIDECSDKERKHGFEEEPWWVV